MGIICQILFHNNTHGVYYAGQTIFGQVTLSTDTLKQVKAIFLKVRGFAETHWTESRTDSNNKSSSESYNGFEKYMSSKVYLFGSSTSAESPFEPGTRTYQFACKIPDHCPSSFEGNIGRISYRIGINIVKSWNYDSLFSRSFTVLQTKDLFGYNSVDHVPVQAKSEKTFGFWPFKSDPLSLELMLPQSIFVPGQTVPLCVLVGNESSIKVHELKVSLAMIVTYYSDLSSGQNMERFSVVKMKADGVLRNSRKQFEFQLQVPSTPPTCFHLCRIIKISYQIEVVAKVKGMHVNATLNVPVTICGAPLSAQIRQTLQQEKVDEDKPLVPDPAALTLIPSDGQQFVEGGAGPTAPDSPWEDDPSIPPPSYSEAMHVQKDAEKSKLMPADTDPSGGLPYKPLYPVFDLTTPAKEKQEAQAGYVEEKKEDLSGYSEENKK
ncbi:arrestin domain-containing protein 17 [Drosophila pseudoobscura]|uniref:Arrestin domain-containing protein 17 n=1 Tax=Drosophila pseudoobscura pseudoobscura TaxID=46245 RepID=A0A6I8V658_DROPS|nr:arrestin domain-containing protein 17 [Drosophila pseudoobscura]